MSDLPDRAAPTDPRLMRASDADRERVAEVLRTAATEGRLHLDELDERLAAVYAARTYAELEPITHDLPTTRVVPAATPAHSGVGRPTSSSGIAILGGFERKSRWTVGRRFFSLAVLGGGQIDLREAEFTDGEVTIQAFAFMGGISVIVPEDAEVVVNGVGVMGGFDDVSVGPGRPGGPRVTVNGLAVWGGVDVRRLPIQEEMRRRRLERKRQRMERRQLGQ